jgi:hypothetical protein
VLGQVRRAVLVAVCCALTFMQLESFLVGSGASGVGLVGAVMAWVGQVEKGDPDSECRRFAAVLAQATQGTPAGRLLGAAS